MILMAVMGLLLLIGIILTLSWGGVGYKTWEPAPDYADRTSRSPAPDPRPSVQISALRYLRGVAIALVGGFWAGALVTGPCVRLIMRLLAVTAGDDARRAGSRKRTRSSAASTSMARSASSSSAASSRAC